MRYLFLFISFQITFGVKMHSQNYTSYFTGNTTDVQTIPSGGVCLMGGASENDNAMIWFLEKANGGDVLVLRASGSDGYNDYMFSELGVNLNSVETIVFNNSTAATESYIHQKIQQAEAIWFAGGNQWNYVSYWRNNAVDSLINDAIVNRNIVIGGTSAGMAIQGGFYFSAENGTVTSSAAISNPYNNNVTIDSVSFISNAYLHDVITDTHYDNPDRKGRHLVFLARILTDFGIEAKGIACDEYTAVCIDSNGIAHVFGEYPSYDDNAYFIQTNCALLDVLPENCSSGNPLDWNLGNEAIKVYSVKGTLSGSNNFDLSDWETGAGGIWENWYVDNGVLHESQATPPDCLSISAGQLQKKHVFKVYPNPSSNKVFIDFDQVDYLPETVTIFNLQGQRVQQLTIPKSKHLQLEVSKLEPGVYLIEVSYENKRKSIGKLMIL